MEYVPSAEVTDFLIQFVITLEDQGYSSLRLCSGGTAIELDKIGNNAYELFAMITDSLLSAGKPVAWRFHDMNLGTGVELELSYGDEYPIDVLAHSFNKTHELEVSRIIGQIREAA